jgi:hypothetical protein
MVVTVDPRSLNGAAPDVVDVYEVLARDYRWAHSVVVGGRAPDDEDEVLVGEVFPDPRPT